MAVVMAGVQLYQSPQSPQSPRALLQCEMT